MLYRCYAKLNLTLEILGRRTDGYHDLRSLVHTVGLSDDLRIEPADMLLTRVEGFQIAAEDNLVLRAAELLANATSVRAGAELTLTKGIPVAAGLGGGSSDAAATLLGLNRFWRAGLGYSAVLQVAASLGSDVPFFVRGGAALMAGRGDELETLPPLDRQWFVVVVPRHDLPNKTARLYASLRPADFSSGTHTERAASCLRRGEPLPEDTLVNGFERAARATFPGLDALWPILETAAGRRFHLSGAGPALFALAQSRADAQTVAQHIAHAAPQPLVVRSVRHARAVARSRFARPRRIGYP